MIWSAEAPPDEPWAQVKCVVCGAKPGERCFVRIRNAYGERISRGRYKLTPHPARAEGAKKLKAGNEGL